MQGVPSLKVEQVRTIDMTLTVLCDADHLDSAGGQCAVANRATNKGDDQSGIVNASVVVDNRTAQVIRLERGTQLQRPLAGVVVL